MRTEAELIAQILEREPDLGGTDVSKCLPGWIRTFCGKFEANEDYTLSHGQVGNLCHTLIAARIRAERLVRERDAALLRVRELESQ